MLMKEEYKKEGKSTGTILIIGVICVILGLTLSGSIPERTAGFFIINLISIIGVILIIGGGAEMLGLFKNIAKDKVQSIKEQREEKNEINYHVQQASRNNLKYEEAKRRFSFLSDYTLLEEYSVDHQDKFVRLALEEELVKRKLIDHSPMHEKLYHLEKYFSKKSE